MSDLTLRLDVEVTVNAEDWRLYYNARPDADVTEIIRNIIVAWNDKSRVRNSPQLHNIQVNLKPVLAPAVPVVKQEAQMP